MPRGISSFPLFHSRPQHHCCCRCRKLCSGKQPGRQVWGCSCGLSNSGPGQGIWETSSILTNTLAISKSALCAQPSMVLQDIWRRGRVGVRLLGGGVYKAERARTVPSLQFGLVQAQSQLASLGLDGRRAGMRRAHACTHQQM